MAAERTAGEDKKDLIVNKIVFPSPISSPIYPSSGGFKPPEEGYLRPFTHVNGFGREGKEVF
jgi:hypothetical protein